MNASKTAPVALAIAVAAAAALALVFLGQWGRTDGAAVVPEPAPTAGAERPYQELPYTPSLDPRAMDREVDPCVDFYRYACGGWMARNPIPADQVSWSVYGKTYVENQRYLWGLLEEASDPRRERHDAERRIGDHFAACMDEAGIEARDAQPIAADLARIASLRDASEIPAVLGDLHRRGYAGGTAFGMWVSPDYQDSSRNFLHLLAGGLGLPDRDYYFEQGAKSQEIRERYVVHVARMLALAGDGPEAARAGAEAVFRVETLLASRSLTRVEKRDPYKVYHRMTVAEAEGLAPRLAWRTYLSAAGVASPEALNVSEPAFFRAWDGILAEAPLAELQAYLRWSVVNAAAPHLSKRFVDADFEFHRAYLRGAKADRPRWKRCVSQVDDDLGFDLGRVYVERTFPPETRARVLDMVDRIEHAMGRRIRNLDWMGEATKAKALEKLSALNNKIGYPEVWRDYSSIVTDRGDYFGNLERARAFEFARQAAKIGRPVDRDEWQMTPPTVNAYYDPSFNDMNFPAGVLQPPLFDARLDDAPNYGNTGGTIGHELIHGFDDEGRQFDAAGNLTDWWTAEDAREFERRAACIADQYAQYVVVDDIKINSELTLGEDVADLAGVILAYEAWKDATTGQALEPRDGLNPEQRFFVGFAQWACANERPEQLRVSAATDPHSPPPYRINGVVVNMREFARAFSCPADAPMVRKDPCVVW